MRKLTVILGMALASFIQAHAFDQDSYYYLSTKFEGDRRVLDILNDGKNNNRVILEWHELKRIRPSARLGDFCAEGRAFGAWVW